jgi:Winged helix-turn helix
VRPTGGKVDISLAGGWIEVASIVHPAGEVVISMRPVSVFANGPGHEIEQLQADLRGRWRQASRAVMVLLSAHGLAPAQIAELLDCHPVTVRRWISRFNAEGMAGLADRPRPGRPALGGRQLTGRIAALLARPGPWTPAADPPVPGLAAGQRADAVPAGAAGGDLAAAEADRPRRPGP